MTDAQNPSPGMQVAVPDLHTWLLPALAYARSFRDLTLQARRAALDDSYDAFCATEDESHAAQLVLLGVIGDAWQVIEDLGGMGTALTENKYDGLPFYVQATTYDDSGVNNFYARIHKREPEYFLRLAGLRHDGTSTLRGIEFTPPREPQDWAAIEAAEEATGKTLRVQLMRLAREWEAQRRFFHAFKHALIVANPVDTQLLKRPRAHHRAHGCLAPAAEVDAEAHGASHRGVHRGPAARTRRAVRRVGLAALKVGEYITSTRVAVLELVDFHAEGGPAPRPVDGLPWGYWMSPRDLARQHLDVLRDRWGIAPVEPQDDAAS